MANKHGDDGPARAKAAIAVRAATVGTAGDELLPPTGSASVLGSP